MNRKEDYFAFEKVKDHDSQIVCYYVTMIGTIEEEGKISVREDLGETHDRKMAFGRVTVYGQNKAAYSILKELNCRNFRHEYDSKTEHARDIFSFTAKEWRADDISKLEVGDRVLIQGRAYVRPNNEEKYPGRLSEISINVSSHFRIARAKKPRPVSINAGLVPQQ